MESKSDRDRGVNVPGTPREFSDIWEVASTFDGWLTNQQARSLWDAAASLPQKARIVEIGSHRGRSTAVLAGAVEQVDGVVVAIDPFEDPRWGGGRESREVFLRNLALLGLHSVEPRQGFSTTERPRWDQQIDLLYVDGAHDFVTVRDDLRWAEWLRRDGLVAVHDGFSSVGVTRALMRDTLFSKDLRYLHRVGSLVWFIKDSPATLDRMRLAGQTFWFARNLAVKKALRKGWPGVLKLLRHQGSEYPY